MKQLFLYDFDGTISRRDTLFDFLKFSSSPTTFYSRMLLFSPWFALAKLGIKKKAAVKQRFISSFLRGKSRDELKAMSKAYLKHALETDLFRESAIASIQTNKSKGEVYIVSASLDIWLRDISEQLAVGLICTRANYVNNVFDGTFATPNCNYEEKPIRVRNELDLQTYDSISYFGDSAGDLPMKDLATHFYYKEFN